MLVHTVKSELECFHQHTTKNETKDIILYHKPYNVTYNALKDMLCTLRAPVHCVHMQSSIVEQHM